MDNLMLASVVLQRSVGISIRRGRSCGDSSVRGEEEGLGSGAVGAEGEDVRGFEASEDLGAWVTEGVVTAYANDCVVWCDGGEEGWVGRCLAAVMADLEQRCGTDAIVGEHGGFAWGFGIAFEEYAGLCVVKAQDKRVVVYGDAGVGVRAFGGEDAGFEASPGEGVSCVEVVDGDVKTGGLGE